MITVLTTWEQLKRQLRELFQLVIAKSNALCLILAIFHMTLQQKFVYSLAPSRARKLSLHQSLDHVYVHFISVHVFFFPSTRNSSNFNQLVLTQYIDLL
jgi:hypothetical protein